MYKHTRWSAPAIAKKKRGFAGDIATESGVRILLLALV